jgi:spermidine synthase
MLSIKNLKSNIEYLKIISQHFKSTWQYRQHIPSFFDEWSFTLGSNEIDFTKTNYDQIKNNYERLAPSTLYYSPLYHRSLVYQPKIVENMISCIKNDNSV